MPTAPLDALYLSPHLDDAVYSCGGALFQRAQAGQRVLVVTICAGFPPPGPLSDFAASLHARWGVAAADAVTRRRTEDRTALALLGVDGLHLPVPDCIYRSLPHGPFLYATEESLFGPLHPADQSSWTPQIIKQLHTIPGLTPATELWAPLALGQHVDHQLVRHVVATWPGRPETVFYYEDYPYAHDHPAALAPPWQRVPIPLTSAALAARIAAMDAYASQRSTFWPNRDDLARSVTAYAHACGSPARPAECAWQLSP